MTDGSVAINASKPTTARTDETDGLKPWQLLRRAPAPVWLLTALFAVVISWWSVVTPIYHAADEPNHADAVMRLEEGRGWTSAITAKVQPEAIGAIAASPFGRPPKVLALYPNPIPQSLAPARDDRPAWKDLKPPPGTEGQLDQQITQHPPGYYWYEALILRAGGAADWRWDIAVSTMRLLSAFLVMWVPLLCWAIAWRVTGNRLAGICAAVFPLGVPELTHVGGTISNDTLLTLSGGATLLGLACRMRGDRSKGTALWTGVWMTVCLWSKLFAFIMLLMVLVIYGLPWLRAVWARYRKLAGASELRTDGILAALGCGIPLALGLWFYIFNEVQYGALAPGPPAFPSGRNLGNDWGTFIEYPGETIVRRWWNDLGWFEVRAPFVIFLVASILTAGLAIYAVLRWKGRRLTMAALWAPTWIGYVIVAGSAVHYFMTTHHIRGVAGRYLYVGFVGAAALVGVGCAVLPRKIARWMPVVLFLGALFNQAQVLNSALDRWWRPKGGTLRQAWSALSAWSSWPVGVLFAAMGVLAVLVVLTLVALVRACLTQSFWRPPAQAVMPPGMVDAQALDVTGERSAASPAERVSAPTGDAPLGRQPAVRAAD